MWGRTLRTSEKKADFEPLPVSTSGLISDHPPPLRTSASMYYTICSFIHSHRLTLPGPQIFTPQLDTYDFTDDIKCVILYSIVSNSGCSCAKAMKFFCILIYSSQSHSNYIYCQLRDFTSDFETEGHVMVYVTFDISACFRPNAMNFLIS